jgi:hypothetical protein
MRLGQNACPESGSGFILRPPMSKTGRVTYPLLITAQLQFSYSSINFFLRFSSKRLPGNPVFWRNLAGQGLDRASQRFRKRGVLSRKPREKCSTLPDSGSGFNPNDFAWTQCPSRKSSRKVSGRIVLAGLLDCDFEAVRRRW